MPTSQTTTLQATTTQTTGARDAERVAGRLKLYFAALSALGGLSLASANETQSLPVIAVFFAVFGFVFVDWLKLFALPPIAAYAAMAVAAFYCVSDFADLDAPGDHQMVAVAQLLVFVQAIMMLQKKSRRIFEQLGVFCLLELIVAAVFNNAIGYGLLLIPIGVCSAWALCLLAAVSAAEGLGSDGGFGDEEPSRSNRRATSRSVISVSSSESAESLASSALRLPRIALWTLAPSVLLIGAIFFFAIPRTTDASRVSNRGDALVGFSDEVNLMQIGKMAQNSRIALRIYTTDQGTGQPAKILGNMYLRGRVVEQYKAQFAGDHNSATWTARPLGSISGSQMLPREFFPSRSTDENFYTSIRFKVICESMRASSLFAVAPYHRMRDDRDIVHQVDRWTIARRNTEDWVFPRTTYEFGTHAYYNGVQTDLLARWAEGEAALSREESRPLDFRERRDRFNAEKRAEGYVADLLKFDIDAMPTAAARASLFVLNSAGERRRDFAIAKALERDLASSGDFRYTLNLDAESIPGLDPIEQFLSVDRKGHCQYFASALVMMLRSQDIPARMVLGYNTDEYNELGEHYVARQLHAHAWVEALIDRDQLSVNRNVYGQPAAQQYWLRLDPTPVAGREHESASGMGQVLDMAQNVWDDYVVDMDSTRQDDSLIGGGVNPMTGSYGSLVDWLSLSISRIRAGELGGGALASRTLFSWPAAILGVILAVAAAILMRFRMPVWIRQRIRRHGEDEVAQPSVPFYVATLQQLNRVGMNRQSSQTPEELSRLAADRLDSPDELPISKPLQTLTEQFYRFRFGFGDPSPIGEGRVTAENSRESDVLVEQALADLTHSIDNMTAQARRAEQTT